MEHYHSKYLVSLIILGNIVSLIILICPVTDKYKKFLFAILFIHNLIVTYYILLFNNKN
jgi:hypothetical protein